MQILINIACLIIGAAVGIAVTSLCVAGSKTDEMSEKLLKKQKKKED